MDELEKNIASLEALLFLNGEALSYEKISSVLGLADEECMAVVAEYEKRLHDADRGLHIISDNEKVQLATKPDYANILEAFVKQELTEELTPASLEALALVAYLGPISRAKIEYLRGVNSSVILRTLTLRGLIERVPDPEHPSGFVYSTTLEFMKHLGMASSDALPEYEKFKDLLKVFEAKKETPAMDAGSSLQGLPDSLRADLSAIAGSSESGHRIDVVSGDAEKAEAGNGTHESEASSESSEEVNG